MTAWLGTLAVVTLVLPLVWAYRRRARRPPGRHHGGVRWSVGCGDAAGRPATLSVSVASNWLIVTGPDEHTITLTPLQAGQLREALRAALGA